MSPELDLLLACARGEAASHLPATDWPRFLALARRHRLTPQAARTLRGHPEVPAEVADTLDRRARRTAARGLAQAAALVEIATILEDAGVPMLALKGPVEALLCRGDLGERAAADIDIHVTAADAGRAVAALGRAGWRPDHPGLAAMAGRPWLANCECSFQGGSAGPSVELHWRFFMHAATFPMTVAEGIARSMPVALGGGTIRTLPPVERILYLCAHGSKHRWEMLSNLLDVALYLRRGLPHETEAVARRMGLWRTLLLSAHLAHGLLGAPLPPWLDQARHPGRRIARMAALAEVAMDRTPAEPDPWAGTAAWYRRLRYSSGLCERPLDKALLLRELVLPKMADIPEAGGRGLAGIVAGRLWRLLRLAVRRKPSPSMGEGWERVNHTTVQAAETPPPNPPPSRGRALLRRRPVRLAYLVTHPIHYQDPLLRRIAADPDIELTVFFESDLSLRPVVDPGFGVEIAWDVDMPNGYRHEFLPAVGSVDTLSFFRPWSYGLWRRLYHGRFDALWVHGYARGHHLAALVAGRVLGLTVLLRDEATPISKPRGPLRRLFKRVLFLGLRGLVHRFTTIGTLNAAYYRDLGVGDDRMALMPYAVDNDAFGRATAGTRSNHPANRPALRSELGLEEGAPVIVMAARLLWTKRADDLLAAYAVVAEEPGLGRPYLLVVGEGERRPHLEAEVRRLGLDRARLCGFKGQRELPAYLDLADIFVLPSIREPWGLVVNEAMACGTAVVVSDEVGCAPDLVRDGVNGLIFKAGDVADLAAALRRLLADPDMTRAMGRAGLDIIRNWDHAADLRGLRQALELEG